MSDILSILSEICNKEVFFLLRGLCRQDADWPNALKRRKLTSGIPKQLLALVICWAGLNHIYIKTDWQSVRQSYL